MQRATESSSCDRGHWIVALLISVLTVIGSFGAARSNELGGSPGLVLDIAPDGTSISQASIAFASDGSIFVCYGREWDIFTADIVVLKSDDRGKSWQQWAVLGDHNAGDDFRDPQMRIAKGPFEERIFVGYIRKNPSEGVDVAWADATAPIPAWSTNEVFDTSAPGVMPETRDFSIDVRPSATEATVVAVGAAIEVDYGEVEWTYAVSEDAGATFSAPVVVHSLTGNLDIYRYEFHGAVSLGGGDRVAMVMHWGWDAPVFGDPDFGELLFIETTSNGLAGWPASPTLIESTNWHNVPVDIVAMQVGDDVVIVSGRIDSLGSWEDRIWASRNGGATWNLASLPEDSKYGSPYRAIRTLGGLRVMTVNTPQSGGWHDLVELSPTGLVTGSWEHDVWGDVDVFPESIDMAEDPTAPGERAVVWVGILNGDRIDDALFFDAVWRSQPGYGVAKGKRAQIDGPDVFDSAPAVGDLDGDGLKEIVLTKTGLDGSSLQVFAVSAAVGAPRSVPLQVPSSAASAPVLFDLDGDGDLEIFVGMTRAGVEAFDGDLNPLPQWPAIFPGDTGDTWVSAGVISELTHGEIVAVNADKVHLLNSIGLDRPGWPWTAPSGTAVGRAAIGDVDADGAEEIVAAFTNGVYVLEADGSLQHTFNGPFEMSGGVTLIDLDGDADLEVIGPTTTGTLLVVHHDGASFAAAFPYDTGTGQPLSVVSAGDLMDDASPALCFTSGDNLFAMNPDGSLLPGYPISINGVAGAEPVINRIARPSTLRGQVIVGDLTGTVHLLTSIGDTPADWPHTFGLAAILPPASGDLDGDGFVDLVIALDRYLWVIDTGVGLLPGSFRKWKQSGSDRARRGCSGCGPSVPTAVGPSGGRRSLIAFAGATPNPSSGATDFQFSLPVSSRVELAVYDLRGRRVRRVLSGQRGEGTHVVHWSGEDDHGGAVASGMYFARLVISDGPVRRVLTRKMEVVR